MTYVESLIENININDEPMIVKVSFGEEMRRTTFNGVTYDSLRDVVANLFGLESARVVLKYQDNDGDKVTMSTNGELREAIQEAKAKEKKNLRLIIELKPAVVVVADVDEGNVQVLAARRCEGPMMRGGFRGHHHHGHPHHPHHDHHAHRGYGRHAHGPLPVHWANKHALKEYKHAVKKEFKHSLKRDCMDKKDKKDLKHLKKEFKHSLKEMGKDDDKHAMKKEFKKERKEKKREYKQQIQLMKANATTDDDFLAIKEFKKQMKEEWKNSCKLAKRQFCHDFKKDDVAFSSTIVVN